MTYRVLAGVVAVSAAGMWLMMTLRGQKPPAGLDQVMVVAAGIAVAGKKQSDAAH